MQQEQRRRMSKKWKQCRHCFVGKQETKAEKPLLSPTRHPPPPPLLVTKHSKNSQRGLNTISSFLARHCITGQPSRNIQDILLLGLLQCSIVTKKKLSLLLIVETLLKQCCEPNLLRQNISKTYLDLILE
jgi:hypothetical protein